MKAKYINIEDSMKIRSRHSLEECTTKVQGILLEINYRQSSLLRWHWMMMMMISLLIHSLTDTLVRSLISTVKYLIFPDLHSLELFSLIRQVLREW